MNSGASKKKLFKNFVINKKITKDKDEKETKIIRDYKNHYEEGMKFKLQKKAYEALREMNLSILSNPKKCVEAYIQKALMFCSQDMNDKGVEFLEECLKKIFFKTKKEGWKKVVIGLLKELQLDDKKSALEIYKSALENDKDNYFASNSIGFLLFCEGNYEEALKMFEETEKSLKKNSLSKKQERRYEESVVLSNQGLCFERMNKKKKAKEKYDEAIKKCPDFIDGRIFKAEILMEEKNFEESKRILKGIKESDCFAIQGDICLMEGKKSESVFFVKKAIILEPWKGVYREVLATRIKLGYDESYKNDEERCGGAIRTLDEGMKMIRKNKFEEFSSLLNLKIEILQFYIEIFTKNKDRKRVECLSSILANSLKEKEILSLPKPFPFNYKFSQFPSSSLSYNLLSPLLLISLSKKLLISNPYDLIIKTWK